MYIDKEKVLEDATRVLNKEEQPWSVRVEGDSIIATWKWMDATFFAPNEINDKTKNYTFTVTLKDNGKWKEIDYSENKTSNISFEGGSLKFGTQTDGFIGKTAGKSFTMGFGQNKQTGETGIITFKFDTQLIKNAIREYLSSCGWKKAGLF